MHDFLLFIQDLPTHLAAFAQAYGPWVYALLFAIIFGETGLIVAPILPGDSLLFAVGTLTAIENGLDLWLSIGLLVVAAILGNIVNYAIGRWMSDRLENYLRGKRTRLLNPVYLQQTQDFYRRHGGKAVLLTRFLPILRTYAPFAAGLGKMRWSTFMIYNAVGGFLWTVTFIVMGNRFGNIPSVKANFHYVIAGILVISVLPAVFEFMRARKSAKSV